MTSKRAKERENLTWALVIPCHGICPYVKHSHIQTPNEKTSEALVKRRKLIASGLIQAMGKRKVSFHDVL